MPSFAFQRTAALAGHTVKGAVKVSNYHDYMEEKAFCYKCRKENVPTSPEVKRFQECSLKRMERETRCRNSDGSRCMKKCRECEKQRDGAHLSLEQMAEAGELPQNPVSVEEQVENKELMEVLYAAIGKLDKREQKVVLLFAFKFSDKEAAQIIGACRKSIYNWREAAFGKLRVMLEDYR